MKTTNEILAILHEFKQTNLLTSTALRVLLIVGSAARGEQQGRTADIDGLA